MDTVDNNANSEETLDEIDINILSTADKTQYINKRIDFDQKTMKRLNTMLPVYADEVNTTKDSEIYSYIVREAINSLFSNDFMKKLNEL